MREENQRSYDRHLDNIMVQNDILETKMLEGLEQGRAEGRAEVAKNLLSLGMDITLVSQATKLSEDEIRHL